MNRILTFSIIISLSVGLIMCGPPPPASITFSLTAEPEMVLPGESSIVMVEAGDPDELLYNWTVASGTIQGDGEIVEWVAPETEGKYELKVTVSDDNDNSVSETLIIRVSRNYYPLDIGNTWTYKDNNENIFNFEIVDNIEIEALGVTTFVKQTTTSDIEYAANFTYIARSSDGISQYGTGGSNAGGDTITFSPELPIYKFPPTNGESWSVEFDIKLEFIYFVGTGIATYEVTSADELTVEAGTFQNVFQAKEDFTWELDGERIDRIITRQWIAADVGVIKFSQEENIGGETIVTEASLQSYIVQ